MTLNPNNLIVTIAAKLLAEEEADLTARWLVFVKRTEKTEEAFKPKLRTAFTKQEASVQAKLRRTPVPQLPTMRGWYKNAGVTKAGSDEAEAASEAYVDAIYTASAWQTVFETVTLPFVTLAYKEAGQAAFVEIGLEATFNVTNSRAREFLQDKVFKFSEEVNEVTREKIRKALVKGLDAGESIPQISKRIASVFDINRGSRTDKIARTEIVGASNNGTHQGYVDSGIVITEVWIDSQDSVVRTFPHNHKINGEEVALGKRFSNGLLHPHDPGGAAGNVINCRCTSRAKKLKEAA